MPKHRKLSIPNEQGIREAIARARLMLAPPPDLRPSEWTEANVRIPAGNAIPGQLRFDNAPYQREPLDCLIDPDCYRITLQWGAQVGKTMIALCGLAYFIAMMPRSAMLMQPSQPDLKIWLEAKWEPLVESNESFGRLIAKPRSREGVNNEYMKSYPGGFLMFAWSGSPKTMRGRSAPVIVADEVDGYKKTKEGHPVNLLWQRSATFGDDRKLLEISTPTIFGESYIETQFLEGDQRRFWVPCPGCGTSQVMTFDNISWPGKSEPSGPQSPMEAVYVCPHCGECWNDGMRRAAIRRGKWIAARPFAGHASFQLAEWYSTMVRLSDVARSYISKMADDDEQTFVNVSMAETYREKVDAVPLEGLMKRREKYAAPVPAGVLILTAGIDMQTDRLEVEIVGWGKGEESWSIEYRVLWGDPLQREVWEELDALLAETWRHENGAQLAIAAAGLDTGGTGGYPQAAFDYLRDRQNRKVFALKGQGGWDAPVVSDAKHRKSGKNARKVHLFLVGDDQAKLIIHRRLHKTEKGPGYMHFPDTRTEEYFKQLTAEGLVVRRCKDGTADRIWKLLQDRNEALDCRKYALAAFKILNPSMRRAAERMAELPIAPKADGEGMPTPEEKQNASPPTANEQPDTVRMDNDEKTSQLSRRANRRPAGKRRFVTSW